MKHLNLLIVVVSMAFMGAADAQTLTLGYDPNAVIQGGVRYRNFGNNPGAGTTYLGVNLGSGSGYAQQTTGWTSGGESFTFNYNAGTGVLTSTVGSAATVTDTLSPLPSGADYLQLYVGNPTSGATLEAQGLSLATSGQSGSTALGDIGYGTTNGSGNFYLTNSALSGGFTLTGTLDWNGVNAGAQENPVLTVSFGTSAYAAPEPSSWCLGLTALIAMFCLRRRLFRA